MARAPDEPDQHFALAHATWRHFYGLSLDTEPPGQPEVDARLLRYQRVHETGALRDFAAAALLMAAIAKVLVDGMSLFLAARSPTELLVFGATCALLAIVASQCLMRLRWAVEHRSLAQRIGTESVPWSKVESLFADARDTSVRAYIQGVRAQGRALRRTETAVLLERSRGNRPADDLSEDVFCQAVRGRSGATAHELTTVSMCLVAGLATRLPDFDANTLLPALWLLGVLCWARALHTPLQLLLDPWGLRGGATKAQRLRWSLAGDLVPPIAVILVVAVTASRIAAQGV
jgi:hypothetical protein